MKGGGEPLWVRVLFQGPIWQPVWRFDRLWGGAQPCHAGSSKGQLAMTYGASKPSLANIVCMIETEYICRWFSMFLVFTKRVCDFDTNQTLVHEHPFHAVRQIFEADILSLKGL
eukprot:5305500-Amphidinium_carterae.2